MAAENLYSTWGIIVIALSCVGLLSAFVALVYLFIYYPNRGGTTFLGYLLIVGVMCMYSLIFAFVLHANEEICGLRRFGLGFVYALTFSCLVIKVLNNWRVDAYGEGCRHPSYARLAHPCSILCIAMFLVLVQVAISVEWLVLDPPHAHVMYHMGRFIPVCAPEGFHIQELIISCIYPIMLILLTFIFSFITWDSAENHRESRWVLFICCVTVGVWLVWTVVSTMTELEYQEPAITLALLLNATCILVCLPGRKIILLSKFQKAIEEVKRSRYSTPAVHNFIKGT